MRVHSFTRFGAIAVLVGALACAGNPAPEADTDETAAARDTTISDTLGGQAPGDRGMEGDTVTAPQYPETSDTFLQNQGTGTPQDTAGYSGMERVDTTGQADQQGQADTTSFGADTTSMTGQDTSWTDQSGDTTGYDPSQLPPDTASSR